MLVACTRIALRPPVTQPHRTQAYPLPTARSCGPQAEGAGGGCQQQPLVSDLSSQSQQLQAAHAELGSVHAAWEAAEAAACAARVQAALQARQLAACRALLADSDAAKQRADARCAGLADSAAAAKERAAAAEERAVACQQRLKQQAAELEALRVSMASSEGSARVAVFAAKEAAAARAGAAGARGELAELAKVLMTREEELCFYRRHCSALEQRVRGAAAADGCRVT